MICENIFHRVYITFSFSRFSLFFTFNPLYTPEMQGISSIYYMRAVYLCEQECPYRVSGLKIYLHLEI